MPESNGNLPATRADVRALETKMEGRLQELEQKIEQSMDRRFAAFEEKMDRRFTELTDSLREFVRDSQTELLRGFQAYATGFDTRLAKLGADFSILDQATERRLTTLERRMLEIETRFPPMAPPPSAS